MRRLKGETTGPGVCRPDLIAVIPIRERWLLPALGVTVTLISLENWSDGLRLRSAVTPGESLIHRAMRWEVTDDLGTRFRFQSGGSFRCGDLVTEERWFTPSLPSAARTVVLSSRAKADSPSDKLSTTIQLGGWRPVPGVNRRRA